MKKLFVFLVIGILLLSLSACSSGQSVRRSNSNYGQPQSFTENLTFDAAKTNFSKLTLDINLNLSQGDFAWTVTNPAGEVVWTGSNDGLKRISEQKAWRSPEAGEWTITVTGEEIKGSVKYVWKGIK